MFHIWQGKNKIAWTSLLMTHQMGNAIGDLKARSDWSFEINYFRWWHKRKATIKASMISAFNKKNESKTIKFWIPIFNLKKLIFETSWYHHFMTYQSITVTNENEPFSTKSKDINLLKFRFLDFVKLTDNPLKHHNRKFKLNIIWMTLQKWIENNALIFQIKLLQQKIIVLSIETNKEDWSDRIYSFMKFVTWTWI